MFVFKGEKWEPASVKRSGNQLEFVLKEFSFCLPIGTSSIVKIGASKGITVDTDDEVTNIRFHFHISNGQDRTIDLGCTKAKQINEIKSLVNEIQEGLTEELVKSSSEVKTEQSAESKEISREEESLHDDKENDHKFCIEVQYKSAILAIECTFSEVSIMKVIDLKTRILIEILASLPNESISSAREIELSIDGNLLFDGWLLADIGIHPYSRLQATNEISTQQKVAEISEKVLCLHIPQIGTISFSTGDDVEKVVNRESNLRALSQAQEQLLTVEVCKTLAKCYQKEMLFLQSQLCHHQKTSTTSHTDDVAHSESLMREAIKQLKSLKAENSLLKKSLT